MAPKDTSFTSWERKDGDLGENAQVTKSQGCKVQHRADINVWPLRAHLKLTENKTAGRLEPKVS